MIHPHTELKFISPEIGHGVFATQFIPRGTVVWTLCELDCQYTVDQVLGMPSLYWAIIDKYAYVNHQGNFILCWDFGRYENHSCDPTCLSLNPHIDIAIRDIAPGEEITCDYGTLNLSDPMRCYCGSPFCRRVIQNGDLLAHGAKWDKISQSTLPFVKEVEQLLYPVIIDKEGYEAIATGRKAIPSHKSMFCNLGSEVLQALKQPRFSKQESEAVVECCLQGASV